MLASLQVVRLSIRKMSFEASVSRLPLHVKEIVFAVSKNGEELVGNDEAEKQEVIGWIDKSSRGTLVVEDNLKDLNTLLVPRTYLAANDITAADVALYGSLRPIMAKLQPSEYHALPAVTRYFNHIQSLPVVQSSAVAFGDLFKPVPLDLENVPKSERNFDSLKKKEKPSKEAVAERPTKTIPAPGSTAAPAERKQKKGKEVTTEATFSTTAGNTKKGGKAPAEDDAEPLPSMIDLRVGQIVDIKKHPDADSLYVEQIDIGEETGPRTVVSGLVNYIPIEQMREKYIVAVCNLKPASMRGIKSFAMVLCATSKDGKEGGIELIQPPPGSKPGDRIYFDGEEFENANALSQLNPKKKIFETIQPGFITLHTKEAAWVNPITKKVHKIRTAKGSCVAPTFVGASLS